LAAVGDCRNLRFFGLRNGAFAELMTSSLFLRRQFRGSLCRSDTARQSRPMRATGPRSNK